MKLSYLIRHILPATIAVASVCLNLSCAAIDNIDSSGINAQKFAKMRSGLKSNSEVFNSAAGKDITVFIGNTGVGKNTLLNLLQGVKLEV